MIPDITKFNREIESLKALAVNQTPELHPLVKETIKQRVLAAVATGMETGPAGESFIVKEKKNRLIKYIVPTLLGLSLLGGTALAANSAKPGDPLFAVKKAEEKIALGFAFSEQGKAELETKFADRRLEELNQIQAENQDETQAPASVNATTSPQNNDNGKNTAVTVRAQTQAEVAAKAEISNAITVLTQVQAKLEAKGNTKTASSVGATLLRLKAKENEDAGGDTKKENDKKDGKNQINIKSDSRTGTGNNEKNQTNGLPNIKNDNVETNEE